MALTVPVAKISELERIDSKRTGSNEVFGSLADLSIVTGLKNLRIYHETLEPGHRSCSPHYHSQKEEFIYVLEGNPSIWLNGEIETLFPGDVVGFPPGKKVYHMTFNQGDTQARLLMISTEVDDDNVVYFPGEVDCINMNKYKN